MSEVKREVDLHADFVPEYLAMQKDAQDELRPFYWLQAISLASAKSGFIAN